MQQEGKSIETWVLERVGYEEGLLTCLILTQPVAVAERQHTRVNEER